MSSLTRLGGGLRRRRRARATLIAAVLGGLGSVVPINAYAATAGPGTSFSSATGQTRYPCGLLCLLGPSGPTVNLSGGGSLIVNPPGIMVDSSGSPSVDLSSSGSIVAPSGAIGVTQAAQMSVSTRGSGGVGGQGGVVIPDLDPSPDPLSGMSGVSVPDLPGAVRSVDLTGEQSAAIGPGVYTTISVGGDAQLTLEPGPYVITGGLDITGAATVMGKSVTLYFGCASYPAPCSSGQTGAGLQVEDQGLLYTTPSPDNASCLGLSVVFDPNNAASVTISGTGNPNAPGNGAVRLDGILYDPAGSLDLTGSGSMAVGQVVSGSLAVVDGTLIVVGSDIPPGPLGGLGGPDTCNLVIPPSAEPSVQLVDTPIGGGFEFGYEPNDKSPVVVDAVDGAGRLLTGFDGPVTMSLATGSGTPGAQLNGSVSVDAVHGVARFGDISVDTPGTIYQLDAAAPSFNDALSTGFDIFPQLGRCEVAPIGKPGDECSASASASDGSSTATIDYTNQTPYPEYVLIGVTPTPAFDPCPHTTNGASDTVTTSIYNANTGIEDGNSVATVDEHIPAQFVGSPPVDPVTGASSYVVCLSSTAAFAPAPDWGSSGQVLGDEILETGVLSACGSTPPPPPLHPWRLTPPTPRYRPTSAAQGPVVAPCTNFDEINGDGSLSSEWLTAGDPVGRGA